MAKRVRGSDPTRSTARLQRTATPVPQLDAGRSARRPHPDPGRGGAAPPSSKPQIVAEERAAEAPSATRASAAAAGEPGSRRTRALAVRAAEEYAYVVRDVRRIIARSAAL